jgi:hypothetical protein
MSDASYVGDDPIRVFPGNMVAARNGLTGASLSQFVIASTPTDLAHQSLYSRLEQDFAFHEEKWKHDTQFTSSLSEKYLHPSYARIIGMGPAIIPFILRSLQSEIDDWFFALRALSGENIVPDDRAGDMPEMADLWISWGRARGLI